ATTSGDGFSDARVRDAAAINDRRVQQVRSQTGLSPDRAVGSGDLAQKIGAERTSVTDKTSGAAVDVEMGRRQNAEQFRDAKEDVSPFHRLGEQPDGRSAIQQLDKSKERQSGGGSGKW
ncbi:MAG: hypothetical protein ACM36C_05440, partial [Acidobacteriota bacterium]